MATVHLHRDDVPDTVALLGALLRDRSSLPAGYDPDETGANVDWDLLTSAESWLSTTEKAVVRIAHGCATCNATAAHCPSNCDGKFAQPSNPPRSDGIVGGRTPGAAQAPRRTRRLRP